MTVRHPDESSRDEHDHVYWTLYSGLMKALPTTVQIICTTSRVTSTAASMPYSMPRTRRRSLS